MRILHTSDWHLGIRHGLTSRGPDHDLFLDWLQGQLSEREIDVLIVAGDVFDSMQPSAEALGRYYRFLSQVGQSGVAQVILIGGNHDSASRLDAPAEVLSSLQVHVVGGIGATEISWERCLLPLVNRAGEVAAVGLAVPYVHEFRLGVRTTDLDHAAVRAQFEERFGAVYSRLCDLARERWPDLPILATGHLTLGEARREDYPQEIHLIGNVERLPDSVLDSRIQYTALGHIHRCYPVGKSRRAWYSGSPIALSIAEASTPRQVLQVQLDADPEGQARVERVEVPAPRGLVELRAEPDALVEQVEGLKWEESLPPLLFCRAVTDVLPSELPTRIHKALERFEEGNRPTLVELRQQRASAVDPEQSQRAPSLSELSAPEVFHTLCQSLGITETSDLDGAFASLSSATEEDFQSMIGTVREGTP